jgi:hypothetical protein
MKVISWNIRGLNDKTKHIMLQQKIVEEKLYVIMIQETKCPHSLFLSLDPRLWTRSEEMTIDGFGATGGLSLLWNPDIISLSHFFSTKHMLSTKFQLIGSSFIDFLTSVYGPQLDPDK